MAAKKKTVVKEKKTVKKSWQENYASFILGAIIVVILGLLVANFITQRNQNIDQGVQTQQAVEEQKKLEEQKANPSDYKVAQDDSLSKIAEKVYGDMSLWPVIAKTNNIANPNIIDVDTVIKLPSKDEVAKIKEDMTKTEYTVAEGDTLFKIAEQVYGDGSKWTILDKANKVGRLANGNPLIFVGNKLVIPR
jgi:nucleoid-associated protein YgaU